MRYKRKEKLIFSTSLHLEKNTRNWGIEVHSLQLWISTRTFSITATDLRFITVT